MIALLLALVVALAAAGQGYGVEVVRTTTEAEVVAPGGIATVGFRVRNPTDRPLAFEEALDLPDGWTPLTPILGETVPAGGAVTRVVAFSVPRTAAAGRYEVRFGAVGARDPGVRDEAVATILVPVVSRLALTVLDPPLVVVAGSTFDVRVRVANEGNGPATVDLEAAPEAGLHAALAPARVELAPKGRVEVTLTVRTSSDEPRRTSRAVRLHATAGDTTTGAVFLVPIAPRSAGRPGVVRHLPGTVGLDVTNADGVLGLQGEVSAKGPLDARERYTVDLLVRAPDAGDVGPLGKRDELRLALETPYGAARLGDQVYPLTELSSPYRWGRGAGATVDVGPLVVGAQRVTSRFDATPLTETAAFVGTGGDEDPVSVRLTAMQRTLDGDARVLGTLQGTVRPAEGARIEGEVGLGGREAVDHAWRVDGEGRLGPATVSVRKLYAGPDYPGFHTDEDLTAGAVVVPFGAAAGARINGQILRQNLALRADRGAAPREARAGTRLSARLPEGWSAEGGFDYVRKLDLLDPEGRSFAEGAFRLGLARSSRVFGARAEAWMGRHVDLFTGERAPVSHVAAWLDLRLPRTHLGLTAGFDGPGTPDRSTFSADDSVGLVFSWEPVDRLAVEVDARRSFGRSSAQVDGRVRYALASGASAAARFRVRTDAAGKASAAALLELRVPFGAPIGPDRTVGAVRGRVTGPDGGGLGGVLVTAGGSVAVTDDEGRFLLGRVQPGATTLEIDRRTVDVSLVPDRVLPLALDVPRGRVADVEVSFAPGARVSGRVVLGAADAADGPAVTPEDGTVDTVRIVLTSDGERLERLTDADGAFAFEAVRPGTWTVTVDPESLPELHRAMAPGELTIGAGADAPLEIVVRPVPRVIQMR